MNETSILVAGSGGQGVLLLGRLIAYGGMLQGEEVTCFPSYGAEIRGGTANCTVIISDEMIGSPIAKNVDILIVMNEASFKKFQPRIKQNGLLLYNSSLIKSPEIRKDLRVIEIPATEMASASNAGKNKSPLPGNGMKSANMVMLGSFIAGTGILKEDTAVISLEKLTSLKRRKNLEENKEAIRKGIMHIADTTGKNS